MENIIYILCFFLLLFVTSVFTKYKFGFIISLIISAVLLYVFVVSVEYTPDASFYEYWLKENKKMEPFFYYTSFYFTNYKELHIFYTSIYSALFLFFVTRFSRNPLLVTILYIPILFLFYVTQLRYFMGLYAVYLAFYYWFVQKKQRIGLFFAVFAIINHYGLILFLPFIYFFLIPPQKVFIQSIIVMISLFTMYFTLDFLSSTLLSKIRFLAYFHSDLKSSFIGGVFVFFPYFISALWIRYSHNKIIKIYPNIFNEIKYKYLYVMGFVPQIYFLIACYIQVIGHRVIIGSLIITIFYFFYGLPLFRNHPKTKIQYIISFLFIFGILLFNTFISPKIFNIDASLNEIEKVLNSIQLFN